MARNVFVLIFCLVAWTAKEVAGQCSDKGIREVAGEREREEMTNILFAEQCVPATECPTYQEKWDRLGQAAFYDGHRQASYLKNYL